MKIIAISDNHGSDFVDKIPECDVLVIAGDISPCRLAHDFHTQKLWFQTTFVSQLKQLKDKAKHIIFIGGNHDTYLSECNISDNNASIHNVLPDGVHYLCDTAIVIDGVKFYGSPWCNLPTWGREGPPVWNFAAKESELGYIYGKIPSDIDILITHGPAHGYCDVIQDDVVNDNNLKIWNNVPDHLGSKALYERIYFGDISPKYVISGHIHSADRNFPVYKKDINGEGTKFVCASILDENYKFSDSQPPLIIIINEKEDQIKATEGKTD